MIDVSEDMSVRLTYHLLQRFNIPDVARVYDAIKNTLDY